MARIARVGDGWLPASIPFDAMMTMWSAIRDMAAANGRDPEALRLVVRANTSSIQRRPEEERPPFEGDLQQLADDVHRCAERGVDEVILDLQFTECATTLTGLTDTFDDLLGRLTDHLATPVAA